MEFKVLDKTENSLQVKVFDPDDSVMYPVVEGLLQDDRVVDVNYSVEHQELDFPILSLEVKEGEDPKKVLTDTASDIKDQFSDIYEMLFEEE